MTFVPRWALWFSCAVTAAWAAAPPEPFPTPGEWPCFRRDAGLLARSPATGRIQHPAIAWKCYVGAWATTVLAEPSAGQEHLRLSEESPGETNFAAALHSFQSPPNSADLELPPPDPTTTVLADVLPSEQGLEKIVFESGFAKPSVQGQWQTCVGRCYARRADQWVQIWETAPIDLLFQPMPLVGDFDADGHPEVAVLPFHELLLLDARSGRIKDRCRFTDTRSYGFFGVYDFDRDGQSEFLVMGDFSKHIDVLGFRAGRLSVLWQHEIEPDISNPQKILRVFPQPVADLDGDGRDEVIASLFNETGDRRWHLRVYDALTGTNRLDLPDQLLAGSLKLSSNTPPILLTTESRGAVVPDFGTIAIFALRQAKAHLLWSLPSAAWQLQDRPLSANVKSTATLGARAVLTTTRLGKPSVVIRQAREAQVLLRVLTWEKLGLPMGKERREGERYQGGS